jgi:DNA-binding transcriptional LysR family regulator
MIDTTLRGDRTFDPATARATVRLAMSDVGVVNLLPALLNLLRETAPGLDVVVYPATPDSLPGDLDRGHVFLGAGVFPISSPWHRSQSLYDDDFLCVFNPLLLDVGPAIALDRFVSERHLLVSRRGDISGVVDADLKALGHERRIAAVVPYFLAAAHALLDTPLLAVFPRRFAEHCCVRHGLAAVPLPFPSPRYTVSLVWHGQHDLDLLHGWLRASFRKVVAI